ncbi:uncharacterized protein LOC143374048 [Andrena cerasifolii]|uniref:uncharacterized protein LOC143374048 n=1 Tax=Andrena cerasifolii TaxID=2819439 RepID=UPI0040382E60
MKNSISDKEANKMLSEILEEDGVQNLDDEDSETCTAACAEENSTIEQVRCECMQIAVNASRFSLRVMEAMRSLQQDEDDTLATSSVEDIVDYIEANYRDDGDLYAQVRTALKQVCSQGFAMELLENEYHLIGPDAISMNRTTCLNGRGDCLLSSPVKTPPRRRKRDSPEDDSCSCETPTAEESGLAKKRGRLSIGDQSLRRALVGRVAGIGREEDADSEEASRCSCSRSLSNEDANDCECVPRIATSANNTSKMQRNLRDVQGGAGKIRNGVDREGIYSGAGAGKEGRSRLAQDPLANTLDCRRAGNRDGSRRVVAVADTVGDENAEGQKGNEEKESVTDGSVSDTVRDVQQGPSGGSRQREEELERWIKRCQEECERRRKRK